MKNSITGKESKMDRRSMVKNGTVFIGTGFLARQQLLRLSLQGKQIISSMSGILEFRICQVSKAESKNVVLRNNNTAKAAKSVSYIS
jgi:hypothetical protein